MSEDEKEVDEPFALHQVVPREQIGAVTGLRYDFQYHQAAAAALEEASSLPEETPAEIVEAGSESSDQQLDEKNEMERTAS